ncbi:MAG: hypothetical protein H0T12_06655 [Actinobacteria bacterium]|nr:hypothetical protein [Actinomycetota bacterium]
MIALCPAPQVRLIPTVDAAVNLQRIEGGAAVHLIRYDYDHGSDQVPLLPELTIEVRVPVHAPDTAAYGCSGLMGVRHEERDGVHRLELTDVPLYSVITLTAKEGGDV